MVECCYFISVFCEREERKEVFCVYVGPVVDGRLVVLSVSYIMEVERQRLEARGARRYEGGGEHAALRGARLIFFFFA